MDFNAVEPGLAAVRAPARITLPDAGAGFQANPAANPRALSVRTHDPFSAYISVWESYAAGAGTRNDAGNCRLPEKLHATFFRAGDQTFMQQRAAQTNSLLARKIGGDQHAVLNKSDAAKALPSTARKLHAQRFQHG